MDSAAFRIVPGGPAASANKVATNVSTASTSFGVHDTLRHGFRSVRAEVTAGHPLEQSERDWNATQEKMKLAMYNQSIGAHLPFRLQMEKAIVSRPTRIPVLPVSNFSLDILAGRDQTVDVEDFLGRESHEILDVHAVMEHQMGWKTV
ncbi:proteasome maturation factor UMP1 [Cladochytrium replicatum]|nr:proteasome maturation factor UMP1 [Cladochytrium replicatum]